MKAAENGKTEIALKLSSYVIDQYYLARTVEIALEQNNEELFLENISKLSSWFLQRSKERFPGNRLVAEEYNKYFSLASVASSAYDTAKEVLIEIPTNVIRDNLFFQVDKQNSRTSNTRMWELKLANFEDKKFKKAQGILSKLKKTNSIYVYQERFFDYLMSFDNQEEKSYKRGIEILESSGLINYLEKFGSRKEHLLRSASIYMATSNCQLDVYTKIEEIIQLDSDSFIRVKEAVKDPTLSKFVSNTYGNSYNRLYSISRMSDDYLVRAQEILNIPEFRNLMSKNDNKHENTIKNAIDQSDMHTLLNPPYNLVDQSLEILLLTIRLSPPKYNRAIEVLTNSNFKEFIEKDQLASLNFLIELDENKFKVVLEKIKDPEFIALATKSTDSLNVIINNELYQMKEKEFPSFISSLSSTISDIYSTLNNAVFGNKDSDSMQSYFDSGEKATLEKNIRITNENETHRIKRESIDRVVSDPELLSQMSSIKDSLREVSHEEDVKIMPSALKRNVKKSFNPHSSRRNV